MATPSVRFLVCLLPLLLVIGCATEPDVVPQQSGTGAATTAADTGRYSGSFMNQSENSGGQARLVIDSGHTFSGTCIDQVWARQHSGKMRTATITGKCGPGASASAELVWSTGQTEQYAGTFAAVSTGCLGFNLQQNSGGNLVSGTGLTFALHEQGVPALAPYGVPPSTATPAFLAQFRGSWAINWYDSGGDWGYGSVVIGADGSGHGAFVNDAWTDGGAAPSDVGTTAASAQLSLKFSADGSCGVVLEWSGSQTDTLEGVVVFDNPERLTLTAGRSIQDAAQGGPRFVMSFNRN